MIHVINSLERLSGAERALLRVVSYQMIRPLTLVSLSKISSDPLIDGLPGDVEVIEINSRLGLLGKLLSLSKVLAQRSNRPVVSWMYRSNIYCALASMLIRGNVEIFWNIRHSLTKLQQEPLRTRFSIFLNRIFSYVPSKIIYVSKVSLKQHEKYGFPFSKSIYIPNGFTPIEAPQASGDGEAVFTIGHAGRLTWEKDIDTLLQAFSLSRQTSTTELKLLMAGPGYSLDNKDFICTLEKYDLLDGSVIALGKISDMERFYERLNLFVLTSASEGFPNVLAEAMLYGIACVSTDVGEAKNILRCHPDWVVPPKSPELISSCILEAVNLERELLNARGLDGRQDVMERFSIDKIAQQYDDVGLN